MFTCPLCHSPLSENSKSYACPQGHQFDKAKEGYVNLLPVQFKHSKQPGDNSEMMQRAGHSWMPGIISLCAIGSPGCLNSD